MNIPVIALAFSHTVLVYIALAAGWQIVDVVWIYWCEGIVLGIFSCIRLVRVPDLAAIAFLFTPWALLHLFYAAFFAWTDNLPRFSGGFALSLVGLLASHALALREAFKRDDVNPPDTEHFCGLAGLRMLPVMITVGVAMYFAATSQASPKLQLVVFLVIAGSVDVLMQIREQRVRRKKARRYGKIPA